MGTLITITGTGLSNITAAWLGSAHDAGINNVSSTQVKITVPADAATGAQQIALGNGTNWGFSPTDFTVTAGTQYDRTGAFYLGHANIFYGTTAVSG